MGLEKNRHKGESNLPLEYLLPGFHSWSNHSQMLPLHQRASSSFLFLVLNFHPSNRVQPGLAPLGCHATTMS